VRELARRLKIHHNTVSEAYKELVERRWLERRRGSRLMVSARDQSPAENATLDDLINVTIRTARQSGYSMQDLRQRVRERLLAEAPDHILVVEQDEGLRKLFEAELRESLAWPVQGCSRKDLQAAPGLAIGALAVAPQYALQEVDVLFPRDRPVVQLQFSTADEHLKTIRDLHRPSVIAVVSASELFLEVARGVLASAAGNRHELQEIFLPHQSAAAAKAADLVFCDSIARKQARLSAAIHYRLILPKSIDYVAAAMKSYRS
jgi:DNA-binding FadR family transcriptional regulator